jgi:3-hydroxypropanoate dehydrogenase
MTLIVADECADIVFRSARSANAWTDKPVAPETLHALYDLMKWGPTSANTNPGRIVFVTSAEAKDKLAAAAYDRNQPKIKSAPVTAILAYDTRFFEWLPKLFPPNPDMDKMYSSNPALAEATAFRNASMQGAYFIMAARMLGLDCGPMSGFNNVAVDAAFFGDGRIKSNFICSIGYADHAGTWPRLPRPAFDEVCSVE